MGAGQKLFHKDGKLFHKNEIQEFAKDMSQVFGPALNTPHNDSVYFGDDKVDDCVLFFENNLLVEIIIRFHIQHLEPHKIEKLILLAQKWDLKLYNEDKQLIVTDRGSIIQSILGSRGNRFLHDPHAYLADLQKHPITGHPRETGL